MSDEPLVWERVEWRQGDGRYRFEVERGGLHAKLTAPHGSSLTLPIVAWEVCWTLWVPPARPNPDRSAPFRLALARAGTRVRPASWLPHSGLDGRSPSLRAPTTARNSRSKRSSSAWGYGTGSSAGRRMGPVRCRRPCRRVPTTIRRFPAAPIGTRLGAGWGAHVWEECAMASYILLASYTEQGIKSIKDTVKRTGAVKELAKKAGITMKESYWTLGQFDVVAVFDAPDDETMTAFSLTVAKLGNVKTQTLRAFSGKEMSDILAKVT